MMDMMKFYLFIITAVFVLWGQLTYAESIPVEHPEEVFSLEEMIAKYNCENSQENPQCAAIDFFLCEESLNFEKCDYLGISGDRYKAFVSETLLKPRKFKKSFYAFPGARILTSSEHDLPEWMVPRAALVWAYSIYPQKISEENWDKLINKGPSSIPLYAFGHGMLFLWKNERWKLWKIDDPSADGCAWLFRAITVENPICQEHTWNYAEERELMELFFGGK